MTTRSKSKTADTTTAADMESAQVPAVVPSIGAAGSLVTDVELEQLVKDFGVIDPFEPELLSGCSYDLRIGKPIRSRNRSRVFDLSKDDFSIESGEAVTFDTMEVLDFKRILLFGFIVNKHSVLAKGLVHPITKVDPGFRGPLAITLFNQGNKAETVEYGQGLVSLIIMKPLGKVERIYGVSQRPSYREGSLDIAAIDNEPEQPLDDKGLSKMYGRPLSRLYERVEELEKRFDVGLIKASRERWHKRWDLVLRWVIPMLIAAAVVLVNQNWPAISAKWKALFP